MLSHTRQKNSLDSQSAFYTNSAVCSLHFVPSLHFVSSLQSAFCTKGYLWHQYSLFLVTVIPTTHIIYHKITVWVNSTFLFFSTLILFFPFLKMETSLIMFQSLHPPPKITLACIACLHFICLFHLTTSSC